MNKIFKIVFDLISRNRIEYKKEIKYLNSSNTLYESEKQFKNQSSLLIESFEEYRFGLCILFKNRHTVIFNNKIQYQTEIRDDDDEYFPFSRSREIDHCVKLMEKLNRSTIYV